MFADLVHHIGKLSYPLFERFSAGAWNNVPRPASTRAVSRGAGHDPDRILLAGGSSSVGWGVVNHDLALAGYLARATAALTGRGADVEVYAHPKLTVPEIREFLQAEGVSRFDAIVLTLGGRESFEFMPTRVWRRDLRALLDTVRADHSTAPGVIIVGAEEVSPVALGRVVNAIAMARARALNRATRELIADLPGVSFVDSAMIPGPDDRHGVLDVDNAELYDRCARRIAPLLAGMLDRAPDRVREPVDEAMRREAIARLEEEEARSDPRVRSLLTTVRDVLHMRSADLFLVDHDEVRLIAATFVSVERSPRTDALSSETLEHRTGLVIPDLAADPRHRERPAVAGPPHLRFYAGYPVESPDGQRVGVLSVVDTRPRQLTDAELSLLRGFAAQAGALLFG